MRDFHRPDNAALDHSELGIDETVHAIYPAVYAGKGRVAGWSARRLVVEPNDELPMSCRGSPMSSR